MIDVKLTENYTGFIISGSYDDFSELYDSINSFIEFEYKDYIERDMSYHILGFLYELRHAYQGSRGIYAVDNELSDEHKSFYGIPKTVKKDIRYYFYYVVTDIIIDLVLFKFFVEKDRKGILELDSKYNTVMMFYSKAIEALNEMTTENQLKKIKKILFVTGMDKRLWLKQWMDIVTVYYIKTTKKQRKSKIMKIIQDICVGYLNEEYVDLKKQIENIAKENNVSEADIQVVEYPDNIKW